MRVTTYARLEKYVDMFESGELDLLVITGRPGVGKTYTIRETIKQTGGWYVNVHLTPLEAYNQMYRYKGKPIVVDDVDALTRNKKMVSLLKQAGDSYSKKKLSWTSTSDKLEAPLEFETESNLCIIANELETRGLNEEALEDRGFIVDFWPTKQELVDRMYLVMENYEGLSVEKKQEVLDFLLSHMRLSTDANLRTLVKGFQLRRFGDPDWRDELLSIMGYSKDLILIDKCLNQASTVEDAARKAKEVTGMSRATFFRKKRRLEA